MLKPVYIELKHLRFSVHFSVSGPLESTFLYFFLFWWKIALLYLYPYSQYFPCFLAAMERNLVNVSPISVAVNTAASSERKGKF